MSAAPDTYVGPAIVGWRSWRILPFERLGEPTSLRLCASGTLGAPKVWTPREAVSAVCGKFETTHEAPWPECECGVYAYRSREDAETHLHTFVRGGGGGALGWALGRVSLWGRIVECEKGWRAEHAYPYAIEVHASDGVAATLRDLYGVDAEQHPPLEVPPERDAEPPLRSLVEAALEQNETMQQQTATLRERTEAIRQDFAVLRQISKSREAEYACARRRARKLAAELLLERRRAYTFPDEQALAALQATFAGEPVRAKVLAAVILERPDPAHAAIVRVGQQLSRLAAEGRVRRVEVMVARGRDRRNRWAPLAQGGEDDA